jgi:hypothetical protein
MKTHRLEGCERAGHSGTIYLWIGGPVVSCHSSSSEIEREGMCDRSGQPLDRYNTSC